MLIGSHFYEEIEGEVPTVSNRFNEGMHRTHTKRIAEQITLLFSHDEVRETCSYGTAE